jgi:hypothetical protein
MVVDRLEETVVEPVGDLAPDPRAVLVGRPEVDVVEDTGAAASPTAPHACAGVLAR